MLHREVAGDGPAVLLLHAGVADARMWEPQWEVLAAEHRVIRVDLPGFGRSELPEADFVTADLLVQALDAEGVERADVVGASYGGRVALELAAAYPGRVRRLVLLSPSLDLSEPALDAFGQQEDALLEAGDVDGAVELNVRTWLTDEAGPELRALVTDMQRRAFELQLASEVWTLPAELDLAAIAAPALVVTGGRDFASYERTGRHLAATMRSARHVHLEWAGHLPSLERPDELNPLLLDALA